MLPRSKEEAMAVFTAAEALEMAKRIEENGESFYRAAAEETGDSEIRELFEDLADQERAHYKVFEGMLESLGSSAALPDIDGDEYRAYVSAALDSALFAGPDKALSMAKEASDRVGAIRAAMGFEKDTMLFYYDLREMVGQSQRDTVSRVISEEKGHLQRLTGYL
jgi:rubrerythrin